MWSSLTPGANIVSTLAGGGYTQMSRTSVAAPFVTGGITLLWSVFPNAIPAAIIRSIMAGISSFLEGVQYLSSLDK